MRDEGLRADLEAGTENGAQGDPSVVLLSLLESELPQIESILVLIVVVVSLAERKLRLLNTVCTLHRTFALQGLHDFRQGQAADALHLWCLETVYTRVLHHGCDAGSHWRDVVGILRPGKVATDLVDELPHEFADQGLGLQAMRGDRLGGGVHEIGPARVHGVAHLRGHGQDGVRARQDPRQGLAGRPHVLEEASASLTDEDIQEADHRQHLRHLPSVDPHQAVLRGQHEVVVLLGAP
mmetsp:Transcript_29403/g.75460  ORF Transcript_29403/g.75460 Transcript_29403/m.75460 type:complete len:238 (+) Transcript_29403:760-1473(+)